MPIRKNQTPRSKKSLSSRVTHRSLAKRLSMSHPILYRSTLLSKLMEQYDGKVFNFENDYSKIYKGASFSSNLTSAFQVLNFQKFKINDTAKYLNTVDTVDIDDFVIIKVDKNAILGADPTSIANLSTDDLLTHPDFIDHIWNPEPDLAVAEVVVLSQLKTLRELGNGEMANETIIENIYTQAPDKDRQEMIDDLKWVRKAYTGWLERMGDEIEEGYLTEDDITDESFVEESDVYEWYMDGIPRLARMKKAQEIAETENEIITLQPTVLRPDDVTIYVNNDTVRNRIISTHSELTPVVKVHKLSIDKVVNL